MNALQNHIHAKEYTLKHGDEKVNLNSFALFCSLAGKDGNWSDFVFYVSTNLWRKKTFVRPKFNDFLLN